MPALVRVLDQDGKPIDAVQVRGSYEPSGRCFEERRRTAQGLCLFPWPAKDERMTLELTAHDGRARVELDPADASLGVVEVRLTLDA